MNDLQLPLLKLFQRLRDRGMFLTIEQYDLLCQSLASGFGLDWESLERICQLLWVKPSLNYDLEVFQREFSLFQRQHQKNFDQYWSERQSPSQPDESPTLGVLPILPPRSFPADVLAPTIEASSRSPSLDSLTNEGITAFDSPVIGKPIHKNLRFEPEDVPVNLEMVRQTWHKLRSPASDHYHHELDVEATIQRISQEGIFSDVVMSPAFRKTADLLLLVDESQGMVPYAPVWQPWIQAVVEKWIPSVEIYRFSRNVSDALYDWQQPLHAEPLDSILMRLHHQQTVVIILSDVGAATHSYDEIEMDLMKQLLVQLSLTAKSIICLNPVPEKFWFNTSAERIANYLQSMLLGGVMLPFDLRAWSDRLPAFDRQGVSILPRQILAPFSFSMKAGGDDKSVITNQEDNYRLKLLRVGVGENMSFAVNDDAAKVDHRAAKKQTKTPQEQAIEIIFNFEQKYGSQAIEFAYYAAFPLTLTTDLAYCLRQEFCKEADWSVAPILLLSDLCVGVGGDLYEIPLAIRYLLLEELLTRYDNGEERLMQIAAFMAGYIQYRLCRSGDTSAKFLGNPPNWIALAMLKQDDEATELIEKELAQYLAGNTLSRPERLRLAAMIRSQGDLLTKRQLSPITLENLARRLKQGDPIGVPIDLERLLEDLRQRGWPSIETKITNYVTLTFDDIFVRDVGKLEPFNFEIVTVDDRGEIITKNQGQALAFREPLATDVGLEMVAIPSGKFMMGSPESEPDRWEDESPQHAVTVQPFFIGKYLVTQDQWRTIASTSRIERELNPNPSDFKGDDNRPVENVSWEEAVEFCQRLSRETGRDYRLATEAEWEYACRAGTSTPFCFGKTITGKLASYDSSQIYLNESKGKEQKKTMPVGNFPPNAFGLYDMHGNVLEWCLDHWHDNYQDAPIDGSAWISSDNDARHVVRGGSWDFIPRNCRSATRFNYTPDFRIDNLGFRVVCEIPRTL
jgi:formylglycine-generating enzyme required for sulfatase activity/uncharacterized protein with von Willebrand factor type A (vWA) domain